MSSQIDKNVILGHLEVICGPMFSGKSEELMRRLRRAQIARQHVCVFKHLLDDRHTISHVRSHDGTFMAAYPVAQPDEILDDVDAQDSQVIGIDEVQFFSSDIIAVIAHYIQRGKRVIVAGLDLDFRGIPFGPMPTLMAIADRVLKLQAICTECSQDAYVSQRLINGQPARFDDPIILIGAHESYQARCRTCFTIDKRPFISDEQTKNNVSL